MTLIDDIGTIFAQRIGEAEQMLQAITARAHTPEPADAQRAMKALDVLALSRHPLGVDEFTNDCSLAIDVRERITRIDTMATELDGLADEHQQLHEKVRLMSLKPEPVQDFRTPLTRIAEIDQRMKFLSTRADAERSKVRALLGQSNRVFIALTSAGVDLRL